MAIYDNRICRECGVTFSGGPRAWYCPDCRDDRRRRQKNIYNTHPSKRPIGSTDICENCGAEYIVASGLQKYCPACRDKMHRKIDNEQGKRYYHDVVDKSERNKKRRKQYAENKDKINLNRRVIYARNSDKILDRMRKWRAANPDKLAQYRAREKKKGKGEA